MNQLINAALDSRWNMIFIGLNLSTSDTASGSPFSVTSVSNADVEITTVGGGTPITINRQAFVETLRYLLPNQHTEQNRCPIGSNKDINLAGPLCVTARNANGTNVMIINYLLPLLTHMNLVNTDGSRPNTIWLA
ncbi:hypothetical protein [Methylotuvimicrobium buryatense]|uniref:Uncharacterized protein n=1 Tax=Methylotuvimicrobium buryatense TaxID=95641 RepID=A0A4P9UKQ7_METBY|nr:hypothetical protein [Methylotuvimicrobium buryatense]QCW81738.1 hypothetical protein EQU24_05345 [Methylotuvimicrobium buryatense]